MPYENLSKRDADLPPVDVKQLLQLNQQLHQPPPLTQRRNRSRRRRDYWVCFFVGSLIWVLLLPTIAAFGPFSLACWLLGLVLYHSAVYHIIWHIQTDL